MEKLVTQNLCVGRLNQLEKSNEENIFLSIAKCYCDIWKEPPWCEDFWKPEEVSCELITQMSKKGAIGIFVIEYQDKIRFEIYRGRYNFTYKPPGLSVLVKKVIGFSWGYSISRNEIYNLSGKSENEWQEKNIYFGDSSYFYIDELGVNKDFRRGGYGDAITQIMLRTAIKGNNNSVLLRTDVDAVPAVNLYQKCGFKLSGVRDKEHKNREYLIYRG